MAVNLASKYSKTFSERFNVTAKTGKGVNTDYDFDGVSTVYILTMDSMPLGNYTRSGTARYGTPNEIGDTKQSWTLSRDRAFTGTIDRRNKQEQLNLKTAGKFLALQNKERIVPEVDTYRLATLNTVAEANSRHNIVTAGATSSGNAYTNFLTLNGNITDNEAPDEGRIAWMTSTYYNLLKQGNFVVDSDGAYKDRKSGSLGTVDGVEVIIVPSSRMPANTDLIISHPSVVTAPTELVDMITHENPPGVNGWLIEGRIVYDAFVDTNKVEAIAVHRTA